MGFLNLLKRLENNINDLFDSYSNNSDMSILLDELRTEFKQHINDSVRGCQDFDTILERHSKISQRISSNFNKKLRGEKKLFLEKIFDIKSAADEIIEELRKEISDDLQNLEVEVTTINDYSTELSKKNQIFINSFLVRYKNSLLRLEKQLQNSDDYYYRAVAHYSDEIDSHTTLIHSSRSKILFNAEQMHEQNSSSLMKKVEVIQSDIKKIVESAETAEKISRKSIISESGFFNSNIATEKFSFDEKVKDAQSNNMQSIKEIELDIDKINSVSDIKRKKILNDYRTQLENIDTHYDNLFKEHLEFKNQVLNLHEISIIKLEKHIMIQKNIDSLKEKKIENKFLNNRFFSYIANRNSEINILYRKLNSTKEQHAKDLEGIERLHNNIINSRKYEKYKAEIIKNTDLEIEEITRDLQLRIAREEIDFNKQLLANNLSLLSYQHDSSFNDLSIEKEKLVLKHKMDIKTLQISSQYNKLKLNSKIEELHLELKYLNDVHNLVIDSGKKHSITQIDQEKHLAILKKEKYKILRNYNNKVFSKLLHHELNNYYLLEKSLEAKVDSFDDNKRLTLNFLNQKKRFLNNLNHTMIKKENLTAKSLMKIESNKYLFYLKELQKKKASDQYRIDKLLSVHAFDLFIQLSSKFNSLSLAFSNNIKNYDGNFDESDFYKNLLSYFDGFNLSLITLLEDYLHALSKSYNGVEPSTQLYLIHSNEMRKHELIKKDLEGQIIKAEQKLKNTNNSLTHILNANIELEHEIARLKRKISSSEIDELRNDYRKQLQAIRTELREKNKSSMKLDVKSKKNSRKLISLERKLKNHINRRPHIKNTKHANKKINHKLFVDIFNKITRFTIDLKRPHNMYFIKLRESSDLIDDYPMDNVYLMHKEKFAQIINYASKKHTKAYKNMIIKASTNVFKDTKKIKKSSSSLNNKYDAKINKLFTKFDKTRKIYKLEIASSEEKLDSTLISIKRNHVDMINILNHINDDNQLSFFNNNLAIDENIKAIERKYTKKLENIEYINKKVSNSNYRSYVTQKRKIRNQKKRNNKIYLADLRDTPRLLREEEKYTLQEFRTKENAISHLLNQNGKKRKQSYNNHKKKISSFNRKYLATINKIKKQSTYQIKQLDK